MLQAYETKYHQIRNPGVRFSRDEAYSISRTRSNKLSTSGMAVIEMGIPTGFVAELESDITKLTNVQKTETEGQKIIMYFDEVSTVRSQYRSDIDKTMVRAQNYNASLKLSRP